jgi:hypothetical protein
MATSRLCAGRPLPPTRRRLPALALAVAGLMFSSAAAAPPPSSPYESPLRFDSETVRLYVRGDTLEVHGLYRFACDGAGDAPVSLAYPYPADSLMGAVRPISVEIRASGGKWHPLPHTDVPSKMISRWMLPPCVGDSLEVRAVYRQALLTSYVRYILTTTLGWGRPLRSAVFEIHLPEGAAPVEFSFPFKRVRSERECFYLYEATSFMPDRDITVTWKEE